MRNCNFVVDGYRIDISQAFDYLEIMVTDLNFYNWYCYLDENIINNSTSTSCPKNKITFHMDVIKLFEQFEHFFIKNNDKYDYVKINFEFPHSSVNLKNSVVKIFLTIESPLHGFEPDQKIFLLQYCDDIDDIFRLNKCLDKLRKENEELRKENKICIEKITNKINKNNHQLHNQISTMNDSVCDTIDRVKLIEDTKMNASEKIELMKFIDKLTTRVNLLEKFVGKNNCN